MGQSYIDEVLMPAVLEIVLVTCLGRQFQNTSRQNHNLLLFSQQSCEH